MFLVKAVGRWVLLTASLCLVYGFSLFTSGPKSDLDPYWLSEATGPRQEVSHELWQGVLDDFLVADESGINLFDYEGMQLEQDPRLDNYITAMARVDPRSLSRNEQMSYWINL